MTDQTQIADSATGPLDASQDARPAFSAMTQGFLNKCPACGSSGLLHSYLKVSDKCHTCHSEFHHHRADDAPPYLTIVIVGHIIIPLMLWLEKAYQPAMWIHWALWPTLAVVISAIVLPRMKGAVVGLQWALKMHGFDNQSFDKPE